jgi:GMP synthase-like glutamine amidotransferase
MRVLSLTHGPLVQAEVFADVLAEDGHDLIGWEITAQGAPPADGYDAAFVFGGDQNVGEEVAYPWLHEEYDALRRWVAEDVPVLGVCLGAQTLAHALGGAVKHSGRLAGFYETELTAAGIADPVLGALPQRFEALNANAYTFEVPAGAVELARGPGPQAFRAGRRAWAVQFHPEVRRDQTLAWFKEDEPELPRSLEALERELDEKLPAWQELGRRLCRAFLNTAERRRD